jgi:deoxyadenosine/deoxycytidine kinase
VSSRLVVIEGLIGVGKTTLCRILQQSWRARLVLEPWEENPFLARFYEDPERFALPAQLFYMSARYAQQQAMRQPDLFSPVTVADYLYAKDRLFAEMTLRGHDLALYERIAGLLEDVAPRPDLVVFLDADTEVIRGRIAERGIAAEQVIPASYLDDLRGRYYRLWESYTDAPVHVVRTDDVDYVRDAGARAAILGMIEGWLGGAPVPGSPPAFGEPSLPLFARPERA